MEHLRTKSPPPTQYLHEALSVTFTSVKNPASHNPANLGMNQHQVQPGSALFEKDPASSILQSDLGLSLDSDSVSNPGSALATDPESDTMSHSAYAAILESLNVHLKDSRNGLLLQELAFCETLFDDHPGIPPPSPVLHDPSKFTKLLTSVQDGSKLRVMANLHPHLMPSAEFLALEGHPHFDNLKEGYNEDWAKGVALTLDVPRPDHAVGFTNSSFTPEQLRKLDLVPLAKSVYSASEGMSFPFLTCEVKCEGDALEKADWPNGNSMAVSARGLVHLYRQAGRLEQLHRRVLCFSVAHDDRSVRIYAHYVEVVEGGGVKHFRHELRSFYLRDREARDRETTYRFFYNVCTRFAPRRLSAIRAVLYQIADPVPTPGQHFHPPWLPQEENGPAQTGGGQEILSSVPMVRTSNTQTHYLGFKRQAPQPTTRESMLAQAHAEQMDVVRQYHRDVDAQIERQREMMAQQAARQSLGWDEESEMETDEDTGPYVVTEHEMTT